MRRLKVWGGTHPDELEAVRFAESLDAEPLLNIEADIANPRARALGKRYVHKNLTSAYPGNLESDIYEEQRAAEILQLSMGYYAVVDVHNIKCFGENTGIVDRDRGVSPTVLGFLGSLGMRNLITTRQAGIHGFTPNSFAIEAVSSGLGGDIPALRYAFDRLANDPYPSLATVADFSWFDFYGSAHIGQVSPDCLSDDERQTLRAFEVVPDSLRCELGMEDIPLCFLGWRYTPNENGYWGDFVVPSSMPDDTRWPLY